MEELRVYIPLDDVSQYIKSKMDITKIPDAECYRMLPVSVHVGTTDAVCFEVMPLCNKSRKYEKKMRVAQEEYEQLAFDFGEDV